MSVTAIRRFDRVQALEQLRLDPTLAKASLSSLAKRWGVARSTARAWVLDGLIPEPVAAPAAVTTTPCETLPVPSPAAPVSARSMPEMTTIADTLLTSPATEPRSGSAANLLAYATAGVLAAVAAYFS